jgi:hypothetical protein
LGLNGLPGAKGNGDLTFGVLVSWFDILESDVSDSDRGMGSGHWSSRRYDREGLAQQFRFDRLEDMYKSAILPSAVRSMVMAFKIEDVKMFSSLIVLKKMRKMCGLLKNCDTSLPAPAGT